jgi:hypothetical protein
VILSLCSGIIESARANQQGAQDVAVVRVGNQRVFIVVSVGVCDEMVYDSREFFLVESDAYPEISKLFNQL